MQEHDCWRLIRTEKNASQWSKDKISELFLNLKLDDDIGCCEITEITSCEGEAVVNNRKAKLIFFYEWVIKMKWKGYVSGSSEEVKGKIEIPNLSEEHDPKDVDINISIKTNNPESEILKEYMRSKGAEIIREKLAIYISSLKEEFSQGMILPTKDNTAQLNVKPTVKKPTAPQNNQISAKPASNVGVPMEMTKLSSTESFKCTAEEFFNAMTIKEMVQAFTQGPVVLQPEKGGRFEFFGGNVYGTFIELIPNEKIKQHWRFKTWPEGHYSEVNIEIDQKDDCTEVRLTQTGIPKNDLDRTKEGWKNYYWQNMKRAFGFGAILV
ncbi:activator of 90 kDa heat shock protein ATPase homolog 1-like [Centruroides sculpturatus]|uniref:activator of 90 kDa heat shock protein ATPase homolog 1-like n=1 Tax=Centruroides sculpturatus TaxID=218467 RepID=UPI000C6D1F3B|nr:activator of 90 kDa heat shock protein ATPase homolog 1-like [Centruroides sculpturatus]